MEYIVVFKFVSYGLSENWEKVYEVKRNGVIICETKSKRYANMICKILNNTNKGENNA